MLTPPKIREIPLHHEVTEKIACTVQDLPVKLGRTYGEIQNWAAKHRVRVSAPFARYTFFSPSNCTLEAGFIADRIVPGEGLIQVRDDGGYTALTATHLGPFSTISRAYESLEEFMRIHGYASAGAPVEYYLSSPDARPEEQKAEIVWPVIPNEM